MEASKLVPGDICAFQEDYGSWLYFRVLAIDIADDSLRIFSLSKYNASMRGQTRPNQTRVVEELKTIDTNGHFPVEERMITEPRPEKIGFHEIIQIDLEGYKIWLTAYRSGSAGVFTIPSESGKRMDKRTVNRLTDSTFTATVESTTVTSTKTIHQTGSWECVNNVLFTKVPGKEVQSEGVSLDYVIFPNDGDTVSFALIQ